MGKQTSGKGQTEFFQGDSGWKFVRMTFEKDPSDGQLLAVSIRNVPNRSPMFPEDYFFLGETKVSGATLERQIQSTDLVVNSSLKYVGDILTLEAKVGNLKFEIREILNGELTVTVTLINSGMRLPDVLLRPTSGFEK